MRFDRRTDMSVSVSAFLHFQRINTNCVEVVALIRRLCF
jgi:hypothetical protein